MKKGIKFDFEADVKLYALERIDDELLRQLGLALTFKIYFFSCQLQYVSGKYESTQLRLPN